MGYKIWDMFYPVMIHFLALQIMSILLGTVTDSAGITLATAVVTIPFFLKWYRADERQWGTQKKEVKIWQGALLVLTAVAANLILSSLVSLFVPAQLADNSTQERLLSSNLLLLLMGPGLLVPICEELVFRGLLFRKMERYMGAAGAVILSAAVFGVYHGNIIQMIPSFLVGIVLNILYHRFKTLKVPVLFHIAFNLTSVFLTVIV